MMERTSALLVQTRHGLFPSLRPALEKQPIDVFTATSCAEAAAALWSDCPPHLVFTEIQLADGNWTDVVALAANAPATVNVIVVARFVDVGFYIQAIERGAFDFIVPPLSEPELLHVIRTAAENAVSRRRTQTAPLPPTDQPAVVKQERAQSQKAVA